MFTRWVFVRLHAAEAALREGRIDAAYVAASQPDLRQHPQAQPLLDALVRPLVARARIHRQAGRYQEALADLDRLAAIGRTGPDVQTLRQQTADELAASAARDADEQAAYLRAADHLRAGRLESCRLDIGRVADTQDRAQLGDELEQRLQRGGQLLQQAAEALERDDVPVAVRLWLDACRRHGRTRESEEFAPRLAEALRRSLERWFTEGRMERILAAREAMDGLLPVDATLSDCERIVSLCARATRELAAADYGALRQTLLRLTAVRRDVAWVQAALDALTRIVEGQEQLTASPLGLFASGAPGARGPAAGSMLVSAEQPVRPAAGKPDPHAVRLDRPLLVLVDGGGSSLLIRRDLVRIGRAGGSVEVDVAVPADIQSHHADLVHRDEECLLTAHGPAQVNRRRIEHALLRDGDRIVLGARAKMIYCKPSARSESAVLRLSHGCRLPQDVSDIILFRDTCLVGPGAGCHVRTGEGSPAVVLFERGGALYARQTGGAAGAGRAAPGAQPVVAGRTLEFGELRLTVKPYT